MEDIGRQRSGHPSSLERQQLRNHGTSDISEHWGLGGTECIKPIQHMCPEVQSLLWERLPRAANLSSYLLPYLHQSQAGTLDQLLPCGSVHPCLQHGCPAGMCVHKVFLQELPGPSMWLTVVLLSALLRTVQVITA